ncbi:MAG: double zinc ribbon domain-containing protein, partial [Candidatus Methylomirabilales bacterium]
MRTSSRLRRALRRTQGGEPGRTAQSSRSVEPLGRFKRWGSELYFALLRLLLPAWCAVCQGPLGMGSRSVVCGACWGGIRILEAPFCPRCGRPFWGSPLAHPPSHRCQACRTRAP